MLAAVRRLQPVTALGLVLATVVPVLAADEEPRLATPVLLGGSAERLASPDALAAGKLQSIPGDEIWLATGYRAKLGAGVSPVLESCTPEAPGLLFVQFSGPIQTDWRASIVDAGVEILDYVQENSYLVRATGAAAPALRALAGAGVVRSIVPMPPEAKLHRVLTDLGPGASWGDAVEIHVVLADPPTPALLGALSPWMTVTASGAGPERYVKGTAWRAHLAEIARLPQVIVVEPEVPHHPTNIEGAMSAGDDRVLGWGTYDGTGIRVAVDDSGITRTGSSTECGASGAAYHPDLASSRILDQYDFYNFDSNACDSFGHGTHVTGTIAGAGISNEDHRGMAPGASLLVYKDCCDSQGRGFTHPDQVFMRAAANDALVVSNSWGGGNDIYDFYSRTADMGALGSWDGSDGNPQYMLMSISSGNDAGKSSSPGTSKNSITVGAMKDGNWPDDGPWCWCTSEASTICNTNCNPDPSCSDGYWPPTQRICFSNGGPVDTDGDGNTRIKPDLVAPGTRITSTGAAHINGGKTYEEKDGTSMAQPSVAGALALIEDAYPTLPDWPEMVKAKLLATATNVGSSSAFGHGMLDVLHAIYDTSSTDTLLFTGNYITATGGSRDHTFTVPAGTDELRVYLAFSDPVSSTTETVNDLDLRVYNASGTLVATSLSREDTVEYVRIGSSAAGTWRANVQGFSVPQPSAKYGIVVVAIVTPPSLTLTHGAADTCVGSGDFFTITSGVSNPGRSTAATQLIFDPPSTGIELFSVTMPTHDGSRSISYLDQRIYHDTATNAYYLAVGQTNQNVSRDVTWTARADFGAAEGNYSVLLDASAYGISVSSQSQSIKVDDTPPGLAQNLVSTDHAIGVCSSDTSVTLTWSAPPDGTGCGVAGYGYNWTYPGTLPLPVANLGAVTTYTETLASRSAPYEFNLRAVDGADNWAVAYASFGPFQIDAVRPGNASGLSSSSHAVGSCTSNTTFQVSFTAAPDAECGLDGYGRTVTTGAPALPPTTENINPITSESIPITPGDSPRYYNLRAVDLAGNWANTYVSYGPFTVDLPPGKQGVLQQSRSGSNIVMSWNADPQANFYRVYRSTVPTFATRTQVGSDVTTTTTTHVGGASAPEALVFYQLLGTSICGQEGPY